VKLPPSRGRGPWGIASFIAIPLFFSALIASTLAQEKPRVVQWQGGKHGILTTWHQPTNSMEARIWLWAFVPPIVLSLIGVACTRLPYGWYIACVAGIVMAMAVVYKLNTWTAHHTARFPNGVDLIPKSNHFSNEYDKGEWEGLARSTALSLEHWTIGIACAAIVVMAALAIRRRYFSRRRAPVGVPLEGVHAPDATTPGV